MRIELNNNALIVIKARNEDDHAQAVKVAQRMVENSQQSIEIAEQDDQCFIMVLSSVWDNFQKQEIREEYHQAKREVA